MRQNLYTTGLALLALSAVVLAPRLEGLRGVPTAPPEAPPVPDSNTPSAASGSLELSAGLDYRAGVSGASQERFLTVEIAAPEDLGEVTDTPVDLSVVMDRSGSMAARGKLDFARAAATHLVRNMAPDDVFSLVTFSTDAEVWIPASHVTSPGHLEARIRDIREGGDTNVVAGLQLGAREIARSVGEGTVGRLVILSDGRPTAGTVVPEHIVEEVRKLTNRGLTVSTIGLGLDYNEDLLTRMAQVGGGSYDFVEDPRALAEVFEDELSRSSLVAARGATLEVELAPGIELVEVYGWETSNQGGTFLGDISAGQTLRWTARVRVEGASDSASMPVATASLSYEDLPTGSMVTDSITVNSDLVADALTANATEQQRWSKQATFALGNHLLEASARAYSIGDVQQAQRIARRSRELFSGAAEAWDDSNFEALAEKADADASAYQTLAPGSAAGRRQVKEVKARANSALVR